jgi:3-oxoadipate enol-lactonase
MDKYDQTIEANSISMGYSEFGEGLSPIIFIHGFPFDKNMWQPQVEALKNTFHIITYDVRGFGKSTVEEIRTASIDIFAEDLIAFMNALHIEKAIVCGFSMGGYILLNALKRYPDRFSAIVLANTQCEGDSPEGKEKRSETMLEIEHYGLKSFTKNFIPKIFGDASIKYKKQLVKTVAQGILDTSPTAIIATLNALANRTETCSSLGQISVPTLIICGADDPVTPVQQAQYMQKNIPNAIIKVIKKASHMANMEQPNQYNKILFDFISNLPHLSTIKLYGNENLVMEPKTNTNLISNLNKENREKNNIYI